MTTADVPSRQGCRADRSVWLDLLVRSLLALGASRKEVARTIASRAA